MWGLLVMLVLLASASRLIEWRFPDPDDILRLVQVRDLLAGQGWFDLDQHRIDPLRNVPMHWSRLAGCPRSSGRALQKHSRWSPCRC